MKKVITYDLRWNPQTNGGEIWVKYEDSSTEKVNVNSVEEFIAVTLVLSKPTVVKRDDGVFESRG